MRLRIDLATEQAPRTAHGQPSDFLAQLFARPRSLQRHFLARFAHQALPFGDRGAARLIDQLGRPAIGLIDDLAGARMRFLDDLAGRAPGLGETLLGALGRGKSFGDLPDLGFMSSSALTGTSSG